MVYKLTVISDMHYDVNRLRRIMPIINSSDYLVFCGDGLFNLLTVRGEILVPTICVRGNCDTEVDQMVLDFPILADYAFLYAGGKAIYATHGHVYNPDNPPPLPEGSVLLNGHTHVPACTDTGDFIYMNPGSVSIPKENSPHSYILWEGNRFTWKDLSTGKAYMEKIL